MRKKRKFKVIYKSNWDNATPEQKKEFAERLGRAYDLIFRKVIERKINKKVGLIKNGKR